MPFDSEDIFGYENLYTTDNKGNDGDVYSPIGTGRKSQYAIGRQAQNYDDSANEIRPKPKKKARSSAKSGGAKKKAASSGPAKKRTTSAGSKTASKKPSASKKP